MTSGCRMAPWRCQRMCVRSPNPAAMSDVSSVSFSDCNLARLLTRRNKHPLCPSPAEQPSCEHRHSVGSNLFHAQAEAKGTARQRERYTWLLCLIKIHLAIKHHQVLVQMHVSRAPLAAGTWQH